MEWEVRGCDGPHGVVGECWREGAGGLYGGVAAGDECEEGDEGDAGV